MVGLQGCAQMRLRVTFKPWKVCPYASCSNYPDCKMTRQLIISKDELNNPDLQAFNEPKILGVHSETNDEVSLRKGPYGFYVQLGEQERKSESPSEFHYRRQWCPWKSTLKQP